jgi:molecular chaperone DnaK
MDRTTIDVGIDLGTTNSTIAVIDGTDARVIPNKVGSTVTPSAVWINDRGKVRVGEEAKERALVSDQENASAEFKLLMGGGDDVRRRFATSERTMLPEELSAEVLKSLKLDFQTNTGEDLPTAVITVPAAFENPQTTATRKAAELAGLINSPLLLEPVAASLAYGFQTESDNVYWFVYDFGGGTFDAAVMRIRDGLIQVVNSNGDNDLGGKRVDWDIVTKTIAPFLASQYDLPNFNLGTQEHVFALRRLKWWAERAKIEVCRTREPAEIHIPALCTDASGRTVEVVYELTPGDVEGASRPHIERSLHLCRKTLSECGLGGSDMERILMVGGSTLNPWVREAVEAELTGRVEFGIDPVTVVARGAAIFAATQPRPQTKGRPQGTWGVDVVHTPVGNVADPDIGGRVLPPPGASPEGYTIEFIEAKTQWRSGRLRLGAEGVFMTQLLAEKNRRHEYVIELCDPTGTRVPVSPSSVSYTLGVVPEPNPPAAHSVVVGLADGSVAKYVQKGARLPAREMREHLTTVALRAGDAEDELRIPVLEGEHSRASRNHNIGIMAIRGIDVRRDLPLHSSIEITVSMDASQVLKMHAYIPRLDQDFEVLFESHRGHSTLDSLKKQVQELHDRLLEVRRRATQTGAVDAERVVAQIVNQQLMEHVEQMLDRAGHEGEALVELDRRVRSLAAVLDEAEDAAEWPELVGEAQGWLKDTSEIVHAYGDLKERNRLKELAVELERAVDLSDPDLLRRVIAEIGSLYFGILEREDGYHIGRFEHFTKRLGEMKDRTLAERLIAQGRRAIEVGDISSLKATNRQLSSLLPKAEQIGTRHENEGDTMALL